MTSTVEMVRRVEIVMQITAKWIKKQVQANKRPISYATNLINSCFLCVQNKFNELRKFMRENNFIP